MKNTQKISLLLLVLSILGACKSEKKEEVKEITVDKTEVIEQKSKGKLEFSKSDMLVIFNDYLKIKNAFVASDATAVKKTAGEAAASLSGEHKELKELLESMTSADDLESQRALFEELSVKLEPQLEKNIASGTIYKQYCPMAFNNKGSFWFSDKEQIANPYFGNMMLRCGSVTAKISK